jgi:FkbM family methyltransferase
MKISKPQFNLVELAIFLTAVAVVGFVLGRARTETQLAPYLSRGGAELQQLESRFGSERNSRYGEEWIIRDFFGEQRDGVFVDVGANHHQRDSNTFFLETKLGWSGVAIDPQAKFADGYAANRPRTRFVPLFVSDSSNNEAVLHVPKNNDLIASSSMTFVKEEGGDDIVPIRANTTTLDDVLERSGIRKVDFLSIDVELHEPQVLKGFSIDRFRPRLIAIESHAEVRQQILDYFMAHGYVLLGKYLRADSENLWFTEFKPPHP